MELLQFKEADKLGFVHLLSVWFYEWLHILSWSQLCQVHNRQFIASWCTVHLSNLCLFGANV